ncbi:TPA: hypothetical protein ACHU97_002119, partial [Streptococcus suis]
HRNLKSSAQLQKLSKERSSFPSDFDELPIGITSLSENQELPSSLFYSSSISYFIPKNCWNSAVFPKFFGIQKIFLL